MILFGNIVNNSLLRPAMTGKELKELRLKANLTQEQLAEKIGSHKQVISRWENERSNISKAYEKLIRIVLK